MCQTTLHVAAGYNNTELVNFLLNQQGAETVGLEAKNMVLVATFLLHLIGYSATLHSCIELNTYTNYLIF
jgi:hypothetical protein